MPEPPQTAPGADAALTTQGRDRTGCCQPWWTSENYRRTIVPVLGVDLKEGLSEPPGSCYCKAGGLSAAVIQCREG